MGIPTITGIVTCRTSSRTATLWSSRERSKRLLVKPDEAQIRATRSRPSSGSSACPPKEERERATHDDEVSLLASAAAPATRWRALGAGRHRPLPHRLSFLTDPALPGEDALVAQCGGAPARGCRSPSACSTSARPRSGGVPALAEVTRRWSARRWLIEHRDVLRLAARDPARRRRLDRHRRAGAVRDRAVGSDACQGGDPRAAGAAQARRGVPTRCWWRRSSRCRLRRHARHALLAQADFAVVALDGLQAAHLLAADRDNPGQALVGSGHRRCSSCWPTWRRWRASTTSGWCVRRARRIRGGFSVGLGYREFSVAPVRVNGLLKCCGTIDECVAERILQRRGRWTSSGSCADGRGVRG